MLLCAHTLQWMAKVYKKGWSIDKEYFSKNETESTKWNMIGAQSCWDFGV